MSAAHWLLYRREDEAGDWQVCHALERHERDNGVNRMKILKKMFAIRKAFDYISAPRQTEHV
ncbi:hypothetical protein TU81_08340 [Pseudomonas lini]|nr:hypothetical protein TU81_08340 [Pseudomonas lini]KNH48039.1 hypothetical protein ACS73_01890 [Pseudomonas lini]